MDQIAPDIRRVFVGDYVDRGERTAETLATLRTYQEKVPGQVICLRGNHEQMLQRFLHDPARHGARWLRHGGLQTLASYAISPPQGEGASEKSWIACRNALQVAFGPATEAWLHELPDWWQTGNVAVMHAGADPAKSLEEQEQHSMLWGHPDFESTCRSDGNWVVHGHTIVDWPRPEEGRIPVDTGAYATGRLTFALIYSGQVEFFNT